MSPPSLPLSLSLSLSLSRSALLCLPRHAQKHRGREETSKPQTGKTGEHERERGTERWREGGVRVVERAEGMRTGRIIFKSAVLDRCLCARERRIQTQAVSAAGPRHRGGLVRDGVIIHVRDTLSLPLLTHSFCDFRQLRRRQEEHGDRRRPGILLFALALRKRSRRIRIETARTGDPLADSATPPDST